jgi:hypothetical protein
LQQQWRRGASTHAAGGDRVDSAREVVLSLEIALIEVVVGSPIPGRSVAARVGEAEVCARVRAVDGVVHGDVFAWRRRHHALKVCVVEAGAVVVVGGAACLKLCRDDDDEEDWWRRRAEREKRSTLAGRHHRWPGSLAR